jgi:hypothetical protein
MMIGFVIWDNVGDYRRSSWRTGVANRHHRHHRVRRQEARVTVSLSRTHKDAVTNTFNQRSGDKTNEFALQVT